MLLTKPVERCILGTRPRYRELFADSSGPDRGPAIFRLLSIANPSMSGHSSELEVEPVQLTVDAVPADVARRLREFQIDDPEFLRRVLLYGITHRTVFETLSRSWRV